MEHDNSSFVLRQKYLQCSYSNWKLEMLLTFSFDLETKCRTKECISNSILQSTSWDLWGKWQQLSKYILLVMPLSIVFLASQLKLIWYQNCKLNKDEVDHYFNQKSGCLSVFWYKESAKEVHSTNEDLE